MKKLIAILSMCFATMFLTACDTMGVFNTAVVTSNYSELYVDYDAAHAAVDRACKTMPAEECADLQLNMAVIENIKQSIETLKSKDAKTLEKLITIENVKAFYQQGKLAWVNIRNIITEHGELNPHDVLLLTEYDARGKRLSIALESLIASVDRKNPDYLPMLENILQIVGMTARTAAIL